MKFSEGNITDVGCYHAIVKDNYLDLKGIKDYQEIISINIMSMYDSFGIHKPYKIKNIEEIAELKNLLIITIRYCDISDISFLSNTDTLIYFKMTDSDITDISPLKNNKKLENIIVSGNKITDISCIKEFNTAKLKEIDISGNPVIDISPLKEAANLKDLTADITDIDFLKKMKNLERFNDQDIRDFMYSWKLSKLIDNL